MPKFDEEQAEYYSFLHDQFNSVGIPATISESRLQMVGAVMEDLAVQSYNITVPNYYEIALKGRYLRNSQSWEMLDLCYNGIRIDAGVIYNSNLNSVYTIIRSTVATKTNAVASTCKAYEKALPKALKKLVDAYEKIQ